MFSVNLAVKILDLAYRMIYLSGLTPIDEETNQSIKNSLAITDFIKRVSPL